MKRGMLMTIYRPSYDSTNGGITSKRENIILVGLGVPEIFPVNDEPYLELITKEYSFGKHTHAQPNGDRPAKTLGPMFGGNFIYASDSRMKAINGGHPIPVHDRFETQAQYDALSS